MSVGCSTEGCRGAAISAGRCLFCASGDVRPDLDWQGHKRDPVKVAAAIRRAEGAKDKPRTPRVPRPGRPTVTVAKL